MQKKAGPAKTVSIEHAGQRLDNYLAREMKGAPRSLIYRLIRTGQVRVNGGRAAPDRKLAAGDLLRIPDRVALRAPIAEVPEHVAAGAAALPVLFEDRHFIAVDKPAGLAVHGGSGVAHGVIERLRAARREKFLELAHRLDKNTSGALLLAKKSSALRAVQAQWRSREVRKTYRAIVFGTWNPAAERIDMPIRRLPSAAAPQGRRAEASGSAGGSSRWESGGAKEAITLAALLRQWNGAALLEADLVTGRTHQLRLHLAALGMPIAGDDKYGDFAANRRCRVFPELRRMFLHAAALRFRHPQTGEETLIRAPLPAAFGAFPRRMASDGRGA